MSATLRARLATAGTPGDAVRAAARSGALDGHTSGLAPGYAQANLVLLPREHALDFLLYCVRNPLPCPLLEVTDAGVWEAARVAPGSDVRVDAPRYRVWRHGVCTEEVTEIRHLWPDAAAPAPPAGGGGGGDPAAAPRPHPDARTDWVAFLLGCSFSFEEALLREGLPVRHLQQERSGGDPLSGSTLAADPLNVPMYATSLPTVAAGPFRGPLVVSMRPMQPREALRAAEVTRGFPRVHGAPVFAGDPALLGIRDLQRPDYGDAVAVREGEVPVFWACGVTPQAALLAAALPLAITHAPGHMFVTSIRNEALAGAGERLAVPPGGLALG